MGCQIRLMSVRQTDKSAEKMIVRTYILTDKRTKNIGRPKGERYGKTDRNIDRLTAWSRKDRADRWTKRRTPK